MLCATAKPAGNTHYQGENDALALGITVGIDVGIDMGLAVGLTVGLAVGLAVGLSVGVRELPVGLVMGIYPNLG